MEHNYINLRDCLVLRLFIYSLILLTVDSVLAQAGEGGGSIGGPVVDRLADRSREHRQRAWLQIDGGVHTADQISNSEGPYAKLEVNLPFSQSVGLAAYFDHWRKYRSKYYFGGGIGISLTFLDVDQFLLSATPSVFGEQSMLGLMLPITCSYGISADNIRFRGSIAIRTAGSLEAGGGDSYAFIIYLLGVGIRLD